MNPKRKVRRRERSVRSLGVELRFPLFRVTSEDEFLEHAGAPATALEGAGAIRGEAFLGIHRVDVRLEKRADGQLVIVAKFSDREEFL